MPSYRWVSLIEEDIAAGVEYSSADLDQDTGIYYWGFGQRGATFLNSIHQITPAGVRTTLPVPPPTPGQGTKFRKHSEIAILDGHLWLCGGGFENASGGYQLISNKIGSQFCRLPLGGTTWETLTPVISPDGIDAHRMTAMGASLYVVGGKHASTNDLYTNGIYRFTPGGASWVRVADFPAGINLIDIHGLSAHGGKLYMNATPSRIVHAWDSATNTWSQLPTFPVAADRLGTAWIGDTMHGLAHKTHHYSYDPVTNLWSGPVPVDTSSMERGGRNMRSDPSRGYLVAARDRDLGTVPDFVARFDTIPVGSGGRWVVGAVAIG